MTAAIGDSVRRSVSQSARQFREASDAVTLRPKPSQRLSGSYCGRSQYPGRVP